MARNAADQGGEHAGRLEAAVAGRSTAVIAFTWQEKQVMRARSALK